MPAGGQRAASSARSALRVVKRCRRTRIRDATLAAHAGAARSDQPARAPISRSSIEHPQRSRASRELHERSPRGPADYLTRHPILLDELLDARTLLCRAELGRLAQRACARSLQGTRATPNGRWTCCATSSTRRPFACSRRTSRARCSVERLADHLSALADVILAAALARGAGACVRQRHRDARRRSSRSSATASSAARSSAMRPTSTSSFSTTTATTRRADAIARLAQRINHLAHQHRPRRARSTTPTCGCVPTAQAACSCRALDGFRRYQREHAWTWEHQALTRARFVAGDAAIGAAFEAIARRSCASRAIARRLRSDVVEMRRKMLAGHPNRSGLFDLKHDRGGMVDVEFIVQYLVLAPCARTIRSAHAQRRQHRAARVRGRPGADSRAARARRARRVPRLPPAQHAFACRARSTRASSSEAQAAQRAARRRAVEARLRRPWR